MSETVITTDRAPSARVNKIYAQYFKKPFPAKCLSGGCIAIRC